MHLLEVVRYQALVSHLAHLMEVAEFRVEGVLVPQSVAVY